MQIATVVKSVVITLLDRLIQSIRGDLTFRRLLVNSGWLFGSGGMVSVLGFVQGVLVARRLGAEEYGALGLIATFTGVMGQIFDSRSSETGIKFITHFRSQSNEHKALATLKLCYIVDVLTALLSFGMTWVLAGWAASVFLSERSYASAIHLYAWALLCGWSRNGQTLLRIFNRYTLLATLNVVLAALRLSGIWLILYVWQLGLRGVLIIYVGLAVISLVIGLILTAWLIHTHFKVSFQNAPLRCLRPHWRELGGFLLSTNFTGLLKIVQHNAPILAVGYWSNVAQVGYYKLAQGFAMPLRLLCAPIFQSVYPELATLWSCGKLKSLKAVLAGLSALTILPSVGVLLTLSLAGSKIIHLTVGESYLPAASVLTILVSAQALATCTIWLGPLLLAAGKAHRQTVAVAIGSLALLVSLFFLVPRYGAVGAAIASLLFNISWGISGGIQAWKMLRDSPAI